MYHTHHETSYTDISYYSSQYLPPSISNPPYFHSISSDASLSHYPLPPHALDQFSNSAHPTSYHHTDLEIRPTYYQDPNSVSSSWVVKQAPPVKYSSLQAVQPVIQEPVASTNYEAFLRNLADQNLITNVHKSKPKHPKANMKKRSASQNVKCQLCKIECTSIELYQKHLSGKKHASNLQKLYAPNITSEVAQASQSINKSCSSGEKVTNLETKKKKLLQGGAAVQSLRVCSICNVACNGEIAFADHMAGKKHLTQERALANMAYPNSIAINPIQKPDETNAKKTNNATTSAWCYICKISCTSDEGLIMHNQGKKHKKNVEKLQNPNAGPSNPALTATQLPSARVKEPEDVETKKRKVLESGTAADAVRTCTICNVVCNSVTVFNFHLAGQKHAAVLKQKPA